LEKKECYNSTLGIAMDEIIDNEIFWNNIEEKLPPLGLLLRLKTNKEDEVEAIGCLYSEETICFDHEENVEHLCPAFRFFNGKISHPKWWAYVSDSAARNVSFNSRGDKPE
jgi:hypothetical protein